MNFRPLGDRLLIEQLQPEETTKSGIIIPQTATVKTIRCKVIRCGIEASSVKENEIVEIHKEAGVVLTDQKTNKNYIVLRLPDILGVIED